MMSRILGNNDSIYTFQEIHFFDELVDSSKINMLISSEKATLLYAKLIAISRRGYFGKRDTNEFIEEAASIINTINPLNTIQVYKSFLFKEAENNNSNIPCEHTPQNIYYLNDVFSTFPDAKVILMIRDPRAVLLSQKNKWKRRSLSGGAIPLWESIRSRINYHPLTISRIWKNVMIESEKYKDNKSVKFIRYEDLISDTELTIKEVCSFLNIDYNSKMLNIPVVGSSNFIDNGNTKGIDNSKTEQWKNGGLNNSELHICQKINASVMNKYSYKTMNVVPGILSLFFYFIMLPFQLFLAVIFNLKRLKNPVKMIKKLFGN